MRLFIAIALPKEIRDYLAKIQDRLKPARADVKWVKPDNIHLTLKFLGEIDDRKLSEICGIIEDTVKDKGCFRIHTSCLGAFPKIDYPRVIWIGIDKGDSETKKIAKELEEKCVKLGIPSEKRDFSSHVTIGRIRSDLNRGRLIRELESAIGNFEDKNLEFICAKITLFKSILTPAGPIYEVLKETNLKTA